MSILIKNAEIVNEGRRQRGSLLIKNERIEEIWYGSTPDIQDCTVIDAEGKLLIPGCIDDQVHFREPGLTHKADIHSESRAAVAGGITSYMEMPNTNPQTTTLEALALKFETASRQSMANYSFYLGATNDNLDQLLAADAKNTCGIKIFMGSSTGNMLVDNENILNSIFSKAKLLIATHCEDEQTIRTNTELYRQKYGMNAPIWVHPEIRNHKACYLSSSFAVKLAKKNDTRLHILHISTADELALFDNTQKSVEKRITAEACVHHLWFSDEDYNRYGTRIKWNPAVKTDADRDAIIQAINDNRIDVIATDHAPHTAQEKLQPYFSAPSGGPLVQHALPALLDLHKKGLLSVEKIVEKTSHTPADIFGVEKRGYIKKGFYADLVLIDTQKTQLVEKSNILYKCGWSPFEGHSFSSSITHTFVNGSLVYENGVFNEDYRGKALTFSR